MRFLTAAIVGLAIAASAPAVTAKHVELKCNTVNVSGTRTRTRYLSTQTCRQTTTIRPIATIKTTLTPKPLTRTKVAVKVATRVVSGTTRTSVVTSTSTKFEVVVPTSTFTDAPFVPTSTEYEILPATTTLSTTITSYTAVAPGPTLAIGGGVPRSVDDDDNDSTPVHRGESRMNFNGFSGKARGEVSPPQSQSGDEDDGGFARRANRGKQVICTPKLKVTATITKKARTTVTQTTRARRSTVTITSTATGTVTSTKFPDSVTSIVQRDATVTLTANTVTFTEKPTLAAVTVTKTLDVRADPPKETTIVDLYSVCDPSRQFPLEFPNFSTSFQTPTLEGITPDAPTCCQIVADRPGAVLYHRIQVTTPGFQQGCYGVFLNDLYAPGGTLEDQCVAANLGTQIDINVGNVEIGGLLQCGARTY
ncbi:hypothetical protein A4X13_0g5158 [Tilletia indica]|uniref:Uncharacterized protein n=1 Tax=Tilletia indica TaxID=43049 RepID=A0A177TJH6_9BASI|nr:hypothetical protein A4X13_0g5158 [Tilletia indica]